MELVRKKVANFINASAEEIIITRNTTEGLNLIAQSLNLAKGDEILTTTDEHGGGEVGLDFLVQTKGITLKKMDIPIPSKNIIEVIQAITKYITPKTKLMMLSHVNTSTGMLMPLAERGINLSKIESRPSKKRPWDYYFFLDVTGHFDDANMKAALSELKKFCPLVKWLGSYPAVS